MKDNENGPILKLAAILNFVGGVSGLLALGAIVFWGGALVEKVRSLDGRVAAIEALGSTSLQKHIASDEKIDEAHSARLRMLEDSISLIHRIDTKVETMSTKLDLLKEQLTKHENESRKP